MITVPCRFICPTGANNQTEPRRLFFHTTKVLIMAGLSERKPCQVVGEKNQSVGDFCISAIYCDSVFELPSADVTNTRRSCLHGRYRWGLLPKFNSCSCKCLSPQSERLQILYFCGCRKAGGFRFSFPLIFFYSQFL